MTPARIPRPIKRETDIFAFPPPGEWENVVRDLKLTKTQERELEVTIRHVLANIEKYRAIKRNEPSRGELVAALKRLEKTLGSVQNQKARSKHLMSGFFPAVRWNISGDL